MILATIETNIANFALLILIISLIICLILTTFKSRKKKLYKFEPDWMEDMMNLDDLEAEVKCELEEGCEQYKVNADININVTTIVDINNPSIEHNKRAILHQALRQLCCNNFEIGDPIDDPKINWIEPDEN